MQNAAMAMMMADVGPPTAWSPARLGSGYSLIDSPANTQARRSGETDWTSVASDAAKNGGRWYVEYRSSAGGSYMIAGVGLASAGLETFVGASGSPSIGYVYTGYTVSGDTGAAPATSLPPLAANDIVQCAVDIDAKRLWLRKAGDTWRPGGDPSLGTGGFDISGLATPIVPMASIFALGDLFINAGQTPFASPEPAGFVPWTAVP